MMAAEKQHTMISANRFPFIPDILSSIPVFYLKPMYRSNSPLVSMVDRDRKGTPRRQRGKSRRKRDGIQVMALLDEEGNVIAEWNIAGKTSLLIGSLHMYLHLSVLLCRQSGESNEQNVTLFHLTRLCSGHLINPAIRLLDGLCMCRKT